MAIERREGKVPLITLTTDFGDDWARAQVELIIDGINPDVKFIPLENKITRWSILEGAFVIAKSYQLARRGAIHIGVVDPTVGSQRRGLIIRSKDYWFVGPDNGLLYPAASGNGIEEAFAIDEERVNITGLDTFHGRDVFAPAAARLSLGESPLNFAKEIDPASIRQLILEENQVVRIDHQYGNIKLATHPEGLRVGEDSIIIDLHTGRVVIPYWKTFSDVPEGEMLAYRGSHGTLELARNLAPLTEILDLSVGQRLEINTI